MYSVVLTWMVVAILGKPTSYVVMKYLKSDRGAGTHFL